MNATRFTIISTILLAGTLMLFVASCGGGGDGGGGDGGGGDGGGGDGGGGDGGGGDGGPETAFVTISAPEPGSVQPAGFGTLSTGNFSEIKSVKVEVYDGVPTIDGDKHTVTGTLLTQFTTFLVVSGPSWAGGIGGLPVGQTLTFVGRAFTTGDASGPVEPDPATEVFTGPTTASLIAGPDNTITLVLGPHTINFNIPQITALRKPAAIKIGDSANIDADVGYIKTSYALDYLFSGAGGTYTAGASGMVTTDGNGDATIPAATYLAGSTFGVFVNSLSVTDPVGPVTGKQDFTLTLVSGDGDGTIVTEFAPTVFSMSARKLPTSSTVEFTAGVSDNGTVVSFLWEYLGTGTPTFDPAAGGVNNDNPGSMVNYDPAAGGDVSLKVTDNSGLTTTVTFPLPVFPDDVIIPIYDFETGTTQGWSTTGLWHVTNFKAAGGSTRSMWFGDEATQDVGSDVQATGILLSPSIVLGATPFLEFDLRNQNECNFPPCGFNKLDLEISSDDGISWTLIAGEAQLSTGTSDKQSSTPFVHRRYDLSSICLDEGCTSIADFSGEAVLFRFRYNRLSGPSYDGAFIDNIMVNNK